MASFFHGVTVTEVLTGGVPIQVIPASVVGVVGSAPTWAVAATSANQPPAINTPTLISSTLQAGALGPMIQGYSIPYSLSHIQAQAPVGQVVVVNVFNPATHQTVVTAQAKTMPASGTQVVAAGHMGLVGPGLNGYTGSTTVVVKNNTGSTTFVENTDYTVDYINGLIYQKSGGAITLGQALQLTYAYCDPSKVTDSDLIGSVTGSTYTGMQCFLTCNSLFGFMPRMYISPAYGGSSFPGSKDQTVSTALTTIANTVKGFAIIDGAPATPVATAISNRNSAANAFGAASYRAVLTYPNLFFTDLGYVPTGTTLNTAGAVTFQVSNTVTDGPYSAWYAGVWSSVIVQSGFWFSPSNNQITGPIGPDVSMYMSFTDPNSDDNNLNAQGITTVLNTFASGLRVWGNRSSAFPTYTDPTTFVSVRMALDVVETSIQIASLQFVDQPITTGLINNILFSVNGFLNDIVRQGGLIAGSAISYNPGDNPPLSLAAGQITFAVSVMPPPPAEKIQYNFVVNVNLLSNINPTSQQ